MNRNLLSPGSRSLEFQDQGTNTSQELSSYAIPWQKTRKQKGDNLLFTLSPISSKRVGPSCPNQLLKVHLLGLL